MASLLEGYSLGSPEVEDLTHPETLQAFRERLRRLLLVEAAGWAIFATLWIVRGFWGSALVHTVALLGTLALLELVRRLDRPRWLTRLAQANLLWCMSALALQAVLNGGIRAMAVWYLAAAPLFAAHQLGIAAAKRWSWFALLLIWAVLASRQLGIRAEFVPTDANRALSASVLVLIVLAFALHARRVTDRQVLALRERERVIRGQADAVALARDEALEAAAAKGQFVANMSHEIRTPLHGMLGTASVLAETRLDPDQQDMVRSIQTSGELLLSVVNDVLDFSKLDSGRACLQAVEFDLEAEVDSVLELFGPQAGDLALEVVVHPGT
ncbi:MAG: histidine kinase dimerization/phospho-acceptor domain-containing protein, partial [Candidatus Eremiobacterota bacterium]